MVLEGTLTAFMALMVNKKESRIEPYVRTLAMADIAHSSAVVNLVAATTELATLAIEEKKARKGHDSKS